MPRSNNRLVVMASGWTKPDWLWWPMASRFETLGYDTLRCSYTKNGFDDIEESAEAALVLIDGVAQYYDHVTFIGHSMGGLTGRYAIQVLGAPVNSYVSLGSPHRGSRLAWLAPWSRSAVQMRPGSDFLGQLDACEWPDEVPALGVQARFEEIVLPRASAKIDFGDNVTVNANHASLPVHQRTFLEIWAWLTYNVFDEVEPPMRRGLSSKVEISA